MAAKFEEDTKRRQDDCQDDVYAVGCALARHGGLVTDFPSLSRSEEKIGYEIEPNTQRNTRFFTF